jgi:RNAse (barnase) inhibitor barstar
MNNQQQIFEFGTRTADAGSFVAEVPTGISSVDALLTALYETLQFPGYFGFNWDALSDCLRDLHWIPAREVVMLHRDLPSISESDLRTYLEILAESVQSWRPDEEHSLRVVFPELARDFVLGVIDRAHGPRNR